MNTGGNVTSPEGPHTGLEGVPPHTRHTVFCAGESHREQTVFPVFPEPGVSQVETTDRSLISSLGGIEWRPQT